MVLTDGAKFVDGLWQRPEGLAYERAPGDMLRVNLRDFSLYYLVREPRCAFPMNLAVELGNKILSWVYT